MNDQGEHTMIVLDTEIPLGPAVMFCDNVFMPAESLRGLKSDIENAADGDVLSYHLATQNLVEARFLNWLPEDEATELRKLPIWN